MIISGKNLAVLTIVNTLLGILMVCFVPVWAESVTDQRDHLTATASSTTGEENEYTVAPKAPGTGIGVRAPIRTSPQHPQLDARATRSDGWRPTPDGSGLNIRDLVYRA